MARGRRTGRAARGALDSSPELNQASVEGPVRTCVGCRDRAAKADLLRVVVIGGVLTVDPAGRLPGRGAHVHPRQECVELADRRRAFTRALRAEGPLDAGPVREHLQDDPTEPLSESRSRSE